MIRAGKLVHPILIERLTGTTIDDNGDALDTWAAIASVRAELVERIVAEAEGDGGTHTETNISFRLRWLDGITIADRLTYAGRIYDLIDIAEPRLRRELELKVRRVGA